MDDRWYSDNKRVDRFTAAQQKHTCFSGEIIDWARYRWEFMRRSKKLKAAYRAVLKLRQRAKGPNPSTKYHGTPEHLKEMHLGHKFGIPLPYEIIGFPDPDKSFDKIINESPNLLSFQVQTRMPMQSVSFGYNPDDRTKVNIKINFDKVNSVQDLKDFVCAKIDEHHAMYGGARANKTNYDQILKIGELKEQGLKNTEIAAEIYPQDVDLGNAARKVSRLLKKFNELVNGGYQDLTFP